MKTLHVEHIACATGIDASDVPAVLERAGIGWESIDTVNWADYPYCPKVKFRVAHISTAILLHYSVVEASVAAVAACDNGKVWEDSCVEFFLMPGGDDIYYNIECNCAGTILVGAGPDRDNRELAGRDILDKVSRWASLGREPFPERIGMVEWEVALVIPVETYFKHSIGKFDGKVLTGNFYKCGDRLTVSHFVSWNAVGSPSPDFHRPESFAPLYFE